VSIGAPPISNARCTNSKQSAFESGLIFEPEAKVPPR
jgi:hypothetical protein